MRLFVFLTLIILLAYICGFAKQIPFQWMDRNYTSAIKGLSIFTILWAHVGAKISIGNIQFIAGIGVALFLICSGYGLEISFEKTGLFQFWEKRTLGVCVPFWLVELLGLIVTKRFTFQSYILDCAFWKPATAYGWFMGYIIICYFLFYFSKVLYGERTNSAGFLLVVFVLWFILESVFWADPNMPFLRARQMLCFPFGVFLAQKRTCIEQHFTKRKSLCFLLLSGVCCVIFMGLTQLSEIKAMPYIFSNMMALLTCFPVAVGILILGKNFKFLFKSYTLIFAGTISFEIYLIHAFTLDIIQHNPNPIGIVLFIITTYFIAYISHKLFARIKIHRDIGRMDKV